MVAVLSSAHPHKINHFMARQQCIIKAHRLFVGDAWITYDTRYRRKAASTKSLDWGLRDSDLHNECFTGEAKSITRCSVCLSETHSSRDCPAFRVQPEAYLTARSPARQNMSQLAKEIPRGSTPVCLLFNDQKGNRCTFNPCKFRHICSACNARHPFSLCPANKRPLSYSHKGQLEQKLGRDARC